MLARTHDTLERIAILSHEISAIINGYYFPAHRRQHFMMLDSFRRELDRLHDKFKDAITLLTEGTATEITKAENKLKKLAQTFACHMRIRKKILKWATTNRQHDDDEHAYRNYDYVIFDEIWPYASGPVRFSYRTSGETIYYNLHGMRGWWEGSSIADAIEKKIINNPEVKHNKLGKALIHDIDKLIESERIKREKLQLEIEERAEKEREKRRKLKTELCLKKNETENLRKLSLFKNKELQQTQKKLVEVDNELQSYVSINSHLKVENHELKVQVSRSNRAYGK